MHIIDNVSTAKIPIVTLFAQPIIVLETIVTLLQDLVDIVFK